MPCIPQGFVPLRLDIIFFCQDISLPVLEVGIPGGEHTRYPGEFTCNTGMSVFPPGGGGVHIYLPVPVLPLPGYTPIPPYTPPTVPSTSTSSDTVLYSGNSMVSLYCTG